MDLMSWIKDNEPIAFNRKSGKLRAFVHIGGQPAEIPIPPEFLVKDDDPAVQFAKEVMKVGPMPADEFKKTMRRAGFSNKQIKMAKDHLGLVSAPEGFRSKWTIHYKDDHV